ncbi:hypothetical protein [Aureimonas phyllosphaerae]|uniref:Uncharacterized protein n=1 Tax=Aureimonas phyllosphaerae TaxID=1166078 RepID=A0A7W6BW87_9HYPH|nr:hypothetical protein [Aureimonas phyllosphaerae]MBB3938062.1 hypothetical protein [Aureimonas phyllosphaerae]MBB3962062.1 hypothetical protein [Aureimonas phyllosphaerae]SFF55147.1 hypothetical protein SAMN05216566_12624 [Aureimonas phyllosphaerae]
MAIRKSYRVFIHEWFVYSAVIEAESLEAAIKIADAQFEAEGSESFKYWNSGRDDSHGDEAGEAGQ